MKYLVLISALTIFVASLGGCEQAQQALDTIDKAKSIKNDVEKKSKEFGDKVRGLIPGGEGESSPGEKEEGHDGEREEKRGREH